MATLFFSYSHKDEDLRDQLEVHLANLKRQGVIDTWHDRRILAGDEFDSQISNALERADVILLLISPDFIASDYCYDIEMNRALERHEMREARVIPVILRPCDWQGTPFGKLLASPKDGRPISSWPDRDEAFLDVTKAIRAVVDNLAVSSPISSHKTRLRETSVGILPSADLPRSSNLRIKKKFTDADKDRYLDEAFEYLARFFEGSLQELQLRNDSLQTTFRRIDAHCFTAVIYQDGKTVSECRIACGGWIDNGITYSSNARKQSNSFNESLTVEADDQTMFLKVLMGMPRFGGRDEAKLSFEGAAEYYWSMLIQRLQ